MAEATILDQFAQVLVGGGREDAYIHRPKGLATTYAYDGFGQLTTQTSPDTGVTQFTFDRLGSEWQYAYDLAGRLGSATRAAPRRPVTATTRQASACCSSWVLKRRCTCMVRAASGWAGMVQAVPRHSRSYG